MSALERSLGRFSADYRKFSYIEQYANGSQDPPYTPKSAMREYRVLLEQAVLNMLPLVVTSVAQQLYVEGYRKPDSPDDDSAWEYWRRNSLDAWQHAVHRDCLTYGLAYVIVVPGKGSPVMRAVSPLSMMALYEDVIHDEWPQWAMEHKLSYQDGQKRSKVVLYDEVNAYTFVGDYFIDGVPNVDSFTLVSTEAHNLGVVPVVRFRNQLSTSPNIPPKGELEPLLPTQDRLNNLVLTASMLAQYASFRQRWVTGMVIPVDPATGKQVEPFNAAVNRVWAAEDPDTRFGEFTESDISKILEAIDATIKHLSAMSQVPPAYLLGDIVNLSAEALAAAEAGLQRKVSEKRTILGEAWAQTMRLAAVASGRFSADSDSLWDNRIVWRDTEARSLAATVDALGKLTQMLQVPPEALWERVPGVTSSDVAAWKKMAEEADSFGNMMGVLNAQAGRADVAAKGQDNAKPGTNVPGQPTKKSDGYGTPSDKQTA
ncbi:phage portal protein [Kutzneria chonburiensis]|uniref:Phage portal protein n=1 Tax=Kutzneria chonburiensis TaxID=1483604 RepID=A0ABV6N3D9_9PSEU|nr:phage portal protein [Kutzneria chonburiensis]